MYARALDDFLAWCQDRRASFTRATVFDYRGHLQASGLAPASTNQKLSAIRKLTTEAVYADWLDAAVARESKKCRRSGSKGFGQGTGSPNSRPSCS
jgi:site-specific recombinase XerD